MGANFLVIIGGPPASGKTTISEKLSQEQQIPLIRKDAIKELMFDCLGWGDLDWSGKLGMTTYRIMDQITETELKAGRSIVIEADFKPEFDNDKFQKWQREFGVKYFQIFCSAPSDVLMERFRQRVVSGERHPGHVDGKRVFNPELIAKNFAPLKVEGELITVDSSKPFESYYPEIKEKLTRFKTGLV